MNTESKLEIVFNDLVELENEIRQKDEIISVLKNKLMKYEPNFFGVDSPIIHRKYRKSLKHITRSRKKQLIVIRQDGSIISGKNNADIFYNAIIEADPVKVRNLNIIRTKTNVVTTISSDPIMSLRKWNNLYINTHSSTGCKKKILDKINKSFNLGWEIKIK